VTEYRAFSAISNTSFVRTTDRERHWPAVEALWRALVAKGDIYKKAYSGSYCVGHEAFLKPSELVDGLCPVHKTAPELIEEENYFFRLSRYKDQVKMLLQNDELRIVPSIRKNEVLNLLDDADDVSFSRPSSQLTWGVPVSDDATQTMYVWADALTNYISALGYGTDNAQMQFWPAQVQLIGKDILRFHAMIWPAMLLAAGLATPQSIYVHGFITVNGEKMSKSLGNVIDPQSLLASYSADSVRFAMLRDIASTEDGDFSPERIAQRYEADLAV
jgi:methionyl-tRNA synthetase